MDKIMGLSGRVVMQRPAKPLTSVRFRAQPPAYDSSVLFARVAELVDARDLKSLDGDIVPVQVRPRVPYLAVPEKPHFQIRYIKDSAGDLTTHQEYIATGYPVLNGCDTTTVYALIAGVPGCRHQLHAP